MGCRCQRIKVAPAPSEPPTAQRSSLGVLHERVPSKSSSSADSPDARSIECQLESALKIDWGAFNWHTDCVGLHEGSMKVVGCLKAHPGVALASVSSGTGEALIQEEVTTLIELQANGIRTVAFSKQILDVPHIDPNCAERAKGYLLQYFDRDSCFLYEEGEPGTEDYFLEPMRKLKLLRNDEGDWTMNRDTIRILKEHNLQKEFMVDLTAIVKLVLHKGVRIVDFQGVLGKDGRFYVADPLKLETIEEKVNRYLLEGVFMASTNPQRVNKPFKEAFVEGLGIDLGLVVPDEPEASKL